jgi:hypothetical protein
VIENVRTCFYPPCATVVDEDGGAEAGNVGGEGNAKSVVENTDGLVLDIVWF